MGLLNEHQAAIRMRRGFLIWAMRCGALLAFALGIAVCLRADEIRLKDGKKLYGVIVAFDDNMFKIKTDFGFVLVEKNKIAAIIPTGSENSEAKAENKPAAKKDATATAKRAPSAKSGRDAANAEPTAGAGTEAPPSTEVSEKVPDPATAKREKTAAVLAGGAARPEVPAVAKTKVFAPALRTTNAALPNNSAPVLAATAAPPAPPKESDGTREEIRGNLYINHANNFRIYKAPSWNLIEDARNALPNAIVAMGTNDESTLLVVGKEKTKEPLDAAASGVEKRVRDVYQNYRQISRRTTTVGGFPGIEVRYRGMADEHDWSGTLVVLTRGGDIFTILGMTYADTDLIQIQENVIAHAIASLDFSPIN
jgi:hypothetical protein